MEVVSSDDEVVLLALGLVVLVIHVFNAWDIAFWVLVVLSWLGLCFCSARSMVEV